MSKSGAPRPLSKTAFAQLSQELCKRRPPISPKTNPSQRRVLRILLLLGAMLPFSLTNSMPVLDVAAQARFDSWTIDNGLPQNSVRAILQTRDGYLWLTTFNGLVRFDGVRFTVFDKSNSPGIQSNRFTTLFEDGGGNLWIGTETSGFVKYAHGVFITYPASVKSWYNSFAPLSGDAGPGLWVSNQETLNRLRNSSSTTSAARDHSIQSNESEIRELEKRQENIGRVLRGKDRLVVYFNGRPVTYTLKDGLPSYQILTGIQDNRGNMWLGTADSGIVKFRDGKFTVYRKKDGLPSDYLPITTVCEDRHGALWFAVDQTGLYRLKDGKLSLYTSADGLPSKSIQVVYEDREGSIWIGAKDAGLLRWRENFVSVYSSHDGLSADNLYPILEDHTGDVWIGAWPGLNRYRDGKFISRADLKELHAITIASLYEDSEGALWIGTYGGGVYNLKEGRLTPVKVPSRTEANGWLAILQDRAGAFWFGTTDGLFKYDRGVLNRLTTADGLPNNRITAMIEDRKGDLWIATLGGVACLNGKTITAFTEQDGLSASHARSLYEDEDGTLWIGTYDGGLNRFKDGRFTRYTMREGMFDNGVFRILDDKRGNFWMSSNRGVYRVRRQELEDFAAGKIRSITTVGYGKSDGMLNPECNGGVQSAGARTRDGRLWFPTQQGVAVIDPAAIQVNSLPPPALIEEFILDDQPVQFAGGVRVLPGQERFEIRYTGLSFIKPEQVRFKYKLEGLEDDWIDAGARRIVNYSYVPPGSYTFRVIAANSDGVWSNEGASLPIIVQPPFYRTWWFLALCTLGVAAALALGHRYRIRKLEREKAAQQDFSRQLIASQEIERKRIAGELHDSLGQNLLVIKNRALIGMMRPEDTANAVAQFGEISTAVSQSLKEVRQLSTNLHPYQLDQLGLTKALNAMIRRVSDAARLDISMEIDNIDGLFDTTGEINIYRVVQECLNNIVKHAAASRADVTINRLAQQVTIAVSDNGKGFSPSEVKSGFGLTGIAERARMLDGVHTVESTPDQGTTITLVVGLTEQ